MRAEGVSVTDYELFRVEGGTVVHANRDVKPLNFMEILKHNLVEDPNPFIRPDRDVGGWNKFIKATVIACEFHKNKRAAAYVPGKRKVQQCKKGSGRGWLNST